MVSKARDDLPDPESPVEQRRHRERAGRGAGEEAGGEDRCAGIDERDHLALPAPRQPSVGPHRKIAAAAIADARRRWRQEEQRIHASGIEGRREAAEIGLHPVDPNGVGVDVKERTLAKLRQRLDHTSAGAEKLVALVGNHDARALAPEPDFIM